MIGFVVVGAFAAAAVTVAAARVIAGRAERKSVEGYERVLDTLGDVTRRSDARAPVRLLSTGELAQPHVRAPGSIGEPAPLEPSARLVLPAPPTASSPGTAADADRLVFIDDTIDASAEREPSDARGRRFGRRQRVDGRRDAVVVPTIALDVDLSALHFDDVDDAESEPQRPSRRSRRLASRSMPSPHRRSGAYAAAAVVVVAGVGVGAWKIADQGGGAPRVATKPSDPGHSKPSKTPTSTTLPTVFSPATATTDLVAYKVPAGSLHIEFSASAACWLGAFATLAASPTYQWMDTLSPNTSTTYDSNGTVYVRLGNPPQIKVTVNGIPLDLPSDHTQPYNVELIPT